ncbi:MAG: hypothetical protein J6L86_00550 [Alphaproteobacteria bacterium]|nr:hypothetical protein [Alphaproteobacteria bacterium]
MAEADNNIGTEELPDISDDALSLSDTDMDKLDLSDIGNDDMAGFPSFLTEKKEDGIDLGFDDVNNPDLGLDDINIAEPAVSVPESQDEADIELDDTVADINLDDVAANTSNLPADDWNQTTDDGTNPDEFLDTPLPETEVEEAGEWPDAETPLQEAETEIAETSETDNLSPMVDEEDILAEETDETGLTPVAEEYSAVTEQEIAAEPEEETILEAQEDIEPVVEESYKDEKIAAELGDNELSEQENTAPQAMTEPWAEPNPAAETVYPEHPVISEKELNRFLKWYSGSLSDEYVEFSTEYESGEIEGTEDCKALNVKVGNSYYGWNVKFDNGINMSLRDVRDYQLYYGRLPASGGVISFGDLTLTFKNIERIVSSQTPEYYSYGVVAYE